MQMGKVMNVAFGGSKEPLMGESLKALGSLHRQRELPRKKRVQGVQNED